MVMPVANPEGIAAFSPWLRGTSYPGKKGEIAATLQGLNHSPNQLVFKERRWLTGCGVDAEKDGAFLKITFRTVQREIIGIVRPAVLPGYDVFDVKPKSEDALRQRAIFATVSRASTDQLRRRRVHQEVWP
jgi:hypothetical protein